MPNAQDEILIRDARPADADAAAKIAVMAWAPIREAFRVRLGDEIARGFGDMEKSKYEQVHGFLTRTPQDAVVATVGGQVVGFATTHLHTARNPDCPVGELGNNAVHPDFGGRGIGAKMGHACLEKLVARGAKVLKVFTGLDEGHAPARKLYEKLGFDKRLEHVEYYMSAERYARAKD
ncbi:MAG: GNAT family N-acetyltransferase [Planctomycetota bacterium]|nr:GNAT family N-acetyltransferase [Planctomycetota bacterium]